MLGKKMFKNPKSAPCAKSSNSKKGETMLTKTNTSNSVVVLVSASVAAAVGLTTGWLMYRERKRRRLLDAYWNGEFVPVGSVQQLFVHPIKSGRAIEAPWLDCTERGARFGESGDREFLVVDVSHDCMFLTAREYPKLELITNFVKDNVLTLIFPSSVDELQKDEEVESVEVNLAEVLARGHVRRAKLHRGAKTEGYDCGDRVGEALTNFLCVAGKREIRLIYFSSDLYTERDLPSRPDYWVNPVPELNDKISYTDQSSYMAFGASSLVDLNEHLAASGEALVDARYLRPNFVISGVPPYDEDRWLSVKIGSDGAEFTCYMPCTRCILITVDPDKGEKTPQGEPLRELRRYRLPPEGKMREKYGEKAIFGVFMALSKPGRVCLGDPVSVRYKPSAF